ncbi:MAG TPA: hypothetical protein VII56_08735 [Rhizomicrobium sp.]
MRDSPEELDSGLVALEKLIQETPLDVNWNEAETRLHFIDRLLCDCLGWPKNSFAVEKNIHGGYADYVLGQPNSLIVEAKRVDDSFQIPVTPRAGLIRSIRSLTKTSDNLQSAMEQVVRYCAGQGVEYGAVCNGAQLVVFIAVRHDKPPLDGRALVIESLQEYKKHFVELWQTLSPEAVRQRRLTRMLSLDSEAPVPPKLSATVSSFHGHRYKTPLQSDLRALADLLINDIPEAADVIEQFYDECYCDTDQLNQYAILNDRIMRDRYAALFENSTDAPTVEELHSNDLTSNSMSKPIAVEALAKRPIVLLGDTGVGKSSFLKNLIIRKAKSEIQNTIYLMVDLGMSGALTYRIRDFILNEIESQLYERYKVDVNEKGFVRSIYNLEVKRFRKSIFSSRAPKNEEPTGTTEFLQTLVRNRSEHLRKAVAHISKGRKKQVVVVIDNSDQRDFFDQQEAFLAAQEIAANWNALAYVSLRPQTYYASKLRGTLSAYANRVFTISPPPPHEALAKRLNFALRIAGGQIHPEVLKQISINLKSITIVLRAIVRSIDQNPEIRRFIANITGGNVRQLMELFTNFIGSPNVDFNNIIRIEESENDYLVPLHEFTKHALLGEYAHYSPSTSLAANVLDVTSNDPREHFLSPIILAYLNLPGSHRNVEGFVPVDRIMGELQSFRYVPTQIQNQLQRLAEKNLIQPAGRATDLSSEGIVSAPSLYDDFRITSVGAYHLLEWLPTFAYVDAMSFDTPIFNETCLDVMTTNANSFDISIRLRRTEEFSRYLWAQWHIADLIVPYFNWTAIARRIESSFASVRSSIKRRENYMT